MNGDDLPPEDAREVEAAELAFGLLDTSERDAAEERAARDPAFGAAVARWRAHAASLLVGPDEAPRPSLWGEIARRLPANDLGPPSIASRRTWRWPLATGLATAAAIVLGIVALRPALQTPVRPIVPMRPVPPFVAVLRAKAGSATLAVTIDRASGRLLTAPAELRVADHDAELWVIPTGGQPLALGVVDQTAPVWRPVPRTAAGAIGPGVTLAVSVEPRGGSPTGLPTGAVILTGIVTAA